MIQNGKIIKIVDDFLTFWHSVEFSEEIKTEFCHLMTPKNHNSMLNMTIYSIVQIRFQNLWFEFEMIEGPSFATWFQLS